MPPLHKTQCSNAGTEAPAQVPVHKAKRRGLNRLDWLDTKSRLCLVVQIGPAEFDSQHGRHSPLTTWSCSAESLPPITHKHLQNEAAVSLRTKAEQPDKRLMWWRSSQQGPRLSLPVDVRSYSSSVAICTPDNLITLSFEKPHVLKSFFTREVKEDLRWAGVPEGPHPIVYIACCLFLSSRQPKIMEEKTKEATFGLGNFSVRPPQSLRQVVIHKTTRALFFLGTLHSNMIFIGPWILDIRSTDLHRHSGPALRVFQSPDAKSTDVQLQGVPQRQVATVISVRT